jgi:hypothetical protein
MSDASGHFVNANHFPRLTGLTLTDPFLGCCIDGVFHNVSFLYLGGLTEKSVDVLNFAFPNMSYLIIDNLISATATFLPLFVTNPLQQDGNTFAPTFANLQEIHDLNPTKTSLKSVQSRLPRACLYNNLKCKAEQLYAVWMKTNNLPHHYTSANIFS